MRKSIISLGILILCGITFQATAQNGNIKAKASGDRTDIIDYHIDNMDYWLGLARKGLVPYSPIVPIPPAEFKGTMIEGKGLRLPDSPDIPVITLSTVTESENSVFVDPDNNQYFLNSNNSTNYSGGLVGTLYGANYFQSNNAGSTFGGSTAGAGGSNRGDPATAINRAGRQFVNFIATGSGQGIAYSDDGAAWSTASIAPNPGTLADKNHMWIDNSLISPYQGNLYTAWTDFGGIYDYKVVFSRSVNNGTAWSAKIPISGTVDNFNHGVNLQTGPNGEVYAVWATYPATGATLTENGIGFNKSLDGGASFGTAVKIISNIKGIRETGVLKNMRVNSFPVMAVDVSGGPNNGNIYVIWTNIGVPGINTGTNKSVYLIRSTDGGSSWSTPIRVNKGSFADGKEAYEPWITCDPETGTIAVIYYDDRNTASTACETWVSYSLDAGNNWTDFRVSDVSFTPSPIPGLASNYMGDYLGITSKGGRVYPCWTDNRGGVFRTYVSPFTIGMNAAFTSTSTNVCKGGTVTFTNHSSGQPLSWQWTFPGGTPDNFSGANPPSITYNSPGIYDVSLVVADAEGTDTETIKGYITVTEVFANFIASATNIVAGNSITFTSTSICNPESYNWTFPGGTPSVYTGSNPPSITYSVAGTYDVSLSVTKGNSSDIKTKTGYITVTPPVYNITNGSATTCYGNFYDSGGPSGNYSNIQNITETFYPSTPGAMIKFVFDSFLTEYGYDYLKIYNGINTSSPLIGAYSGTSSPGIVYASNASGALTFNFTADLSETYAGWAARISCYTITNPPIADFSASSLNPVVNSIVTFTDQSTDAPTVWNWNISPHSFIYVGGTNANSQNPQVQFTDTGQYTISLIAGNTNGSDQEVKENYINVIPETYCIPVYSSGTGGGDFISLVQLGAINNETGASTFPFYAYYNNLSADLLRNTTYSITLSPGSYSSGNNISVWIDYNQNMIFEANEKLGNVVVQSAPETGSISFRVPLSALAGNTRMRVKETWNINAIDPCSGYLYGETEDYNVNILNDDRSLNLIVFLEGLFNGTSMNKARNESGNQFPGTIADKITIELHNSTSPYAIAGGPYTVDVNTNGTASVSIPVSFGASYYIVVKHRNSIETWNGSPLSFDGAYISYNFGTLADQAYGSNLKLISGKYVIYSGDVNQDGILDSGDMTPMDNDASNFVNGYLVTDLNGDGVVNSSDMELLNQNAALFVARIVP
jgi:PKD repeat protein